jgi:hypothetical protein
MPDMRGNGYSIVRVLEHRDDRLPMSHRGDDAAIVDKLLSLAGPDQKARWRQLRVSTALRRESYDRSADRDRVVRLRRFF